MLVVCFDGRYFVESWSNHHRKKPGFLPSLGFFRTDKLSRLRFTVGLSHDWLITDALILESAES